MGYQAKTWSVFNDRCPWIMTALSLDQFNRLMTELNLFETSPIVAIATSGGPDSLALSLLAHEWAKEKGGKAIALTVDHHLRNESTREAFQVKTWLEARAMEHHILNWIPVEKPTTGLQAKARDARYGLLGEWCKIHGVKHLLIAHHAQDQLETFMIRLAKGSGLKGLTGMQGKVATDFGYILRPLLTIDSQDLKDTLQKAEQPYMKDPSNENEDFTRIRWRKILPLLEAEGLNSTTFQETLDRLNHAQKLIDQQITRLFEQYVTLSPHGYAILTKNTLEESPEAFEEILKRVLTILGTRAYPVRRQALHRAMDAMTAGNSLTLGGCQILDKAKEWWIVREPAAVSDDINATQPGAYDWDDRFSVEVTKAPCRISALGEKGLQKMSQETKKSLKAIPHIVLQTLPALWQGDDLLDPLPAFKFKPCLK
jgi:tRNA(Ile)-lysidine synthase